MPNPQIIGIIGGGALGGALGRRLVDPAVSVLYWDVDPKLRTASSLDSLVESSDMILICTPSQTNRVIARDVAQVIKSSHGPTIISLAKGVEDGFKTMDVVLRDELDEHFNTGIISGPMLAAEITAGQGAGATVATTSEAATSDMASHLQRAGFIVQTSADTVGVARAGALKNIFALGLGLVDGLQLGYNFKSVFTVKAIEDFQALLAHFGSDPQLAWGMAGLGDLLTTGWSGLSFNWRTGKAWSEGHNDAKGEGINTLRELVKVIPTQNFPVIQALEAVFMKGADPQLIVSWLSVNAPL